MLLKLFLLWDRPKQMLAKNHGTRWMEIELKVQSLTNANIKQVKSQ